MADPIQRQDLGTLIQSNAGQRLSRGARSVDRSARVEAGPEGEGGQILSAIVSAAGTIGKGVQMDFQKKLEADKIRQANQALRGLEPTNEASEAGLVAHSVVGLQNKTLSAATRLKAQAATFQGTDDEWDDVVSSEFSSIQEEMYSEYPQIQSDAPKQEFLGHITNAFGEQSLNIAQARIAGKLDQEHQSRKRQFTDNLILRSLELSGDELVASMDGLMTDARGALQLTEAEADATLTDAAIAAAADGDGRLLEYTKVYKGSGKTSLQERSGKLQTAQQKFEAQQNTQTEGAIAAMRDGLETELMEGSLHWEEVLVKADEQNLASNGKAWSASQLLALKDKRQTYLKKGANIKLGLEAFLKSGEEGSDIAGITIPEEKDQQPIIDAAEELIDTSMKQILARLPNGGTDGERKQAKANATRQLAEQVSAAQFTNKKWKAQFENLQTLNLENIDLDGALPPNAEEAIELWRTLPSGSQLDHTDAKSAAFMSNMEAFERQGLSPLQALDAAQKNAKFSRTIGLGEHKDIRAASDEVADDITEASILPWDNAPAWYKERFRDTVHQATMLNVRAGYRDSQKAAEAAGAAFERYYTQTENGHLLFGNRSILATQMEIHPNDLEETLDTYLEMNKTSLLDEAGGASLDELYFDVIPNRGTVVIRSGLTTQPLTVPIPLSELRAGQGQFRAEREVEREAERVESSIMGNSFLPGGIPKAKPPKVEPTIAQPTEVKAFEQALQSVENSTKSGFDTKHKVWSPHESLEGGTPTIAYGHKLTKEEARSKTIKVGNTTYSTREGESEVTEEIAVALMRQDIKLSVAHLQTKWPDFDSLPPKYKGVLTNLQFNTGDVTPKEWSKLKIAMENGDDAAVRKQMITSFKGEGKRVKLNTRAETMADALGLK